MFGDVFESPEDMEFTAQLGTVLTYEQRKPKNCAHFLDLPPIKRETNFCGLKNQGATCYLNSLIQLCYMSPEFRNSILRLPLCKETVDEPSDFVPAKSSKFKILFALQKLFSEMQDLDVRSLSTEQVTESFGWNDNQAMVQQDIQEANRVIFDVLERALFGTEFSDSLPKYYKGTSVNILECLGCGTVREREESFYDLMLQVKGFSCIEESLFSMLTLEKLEGSNQYFCEICNKKVDAYKGIKVRKFPPILTFSLSRFEYDFMKDQMKKINDSFQFGLELDISVFAEKAELYEKEEDKIYELAGVLIHRGDPYGGHYHAYIRDQMKEGDWSQQFAQTIAQKEKRKQDKEKEKEATEQAAAAYKEAEAKKEAEAAAKKEEEQQTKEIVTEKEGEKAVEEVSTDEEGKGPKDQKNNKKRNKGKDKGGKKKRKNAGDTEPVGGTATAPAKEEKRKELYDDSVFDEVDFPVEFRNKDLIYDWFDFNDSTVTAIPVNRLQTQFGGGGSENAYILVYRQKSLVNDPNHKKLDLHSYLKTSIANHNETYEKERIAYKEAETQLEVIILDSGLLNIPERKLIEQTNPVEAGNKVRVHFEDKLGDIYKHLKFEGAEDFVLAEMQTLPNGLVQFKRTLDFASAEQKISDLDIECWSIWVPFKKDDFVFTQAILPYCGKDFVPIRVNLRNPQSKDTLVVTFQNTKLGDFRRQIEGVCGVAYDQQLLLLMEGEIPKILNGQEESNEEELKKLGISDNTDIMVNEIDPEELRKQQEEAKKAQGETGDGKEGKKEDANLTENLTSVLVERDDEDGVVKYYVDLDWTLAELIENIKKKVNITSDSERRLRRLNGNVLFYEEELPLKLRNLSFEEGGIRLRIERGKTPQFGNLSIRVRNQSKFKKETDPEMFDAIGFPTESILDFKNKVCKELGLEPKDHKLYQTDWLEDPVQLMSKEERLLREAAVKQGDLLVLRDKDSPIPKEVLKLSLYITQTGLPEDSKYIGVIQAREEQSLLELKNVILMMPEFAGAQNDVALLRLRELRKDLFFGKIYRDHAKNLKKLGVESNMSIVAQVLQKPENLSENTMVLLLKKRLVDTQTYGGYEEFIWEASKEPTIEEFKRAVVAFKQLGAGADDVELAKYVPHEFQWLHVSKEVIEREKKAKKSGGKAKNKNKKAKLEAEPEPASGVENLRRAPYLLHDGDLVGYRIEKENTEKKDDFQTKEDEELRKKFMEAKARADSEKVSTRKNQNVGGFQIYTDF